MSKINLFEKTLNSKLAWQGTYLKVIRDEVELPNGKRGTREFITHPGAALVIPMLSATKVLMIRQFRYAMKKEFLEFPAGKIDKGESSLQTAKREMLEETGYEAQTLRFLTTIHPVIGYADEKIDIYLGENLIKRGESQLDHNEFLNIEEVEISELKKFIQAGDLTDVKTQIAAFWLEKVLQSGW